MYNSHVLRVSTKETRMSSDKPTLLIDEAGSDERGPRVVLRGDEAQVSALARHLYCFLTFTLPGETETEAAPALLSSPVPAPWLSKGFGWHEVLGLHRIDRDWYVATVVGQTVTIWNDDMSASETLEAPAGSDPRLFAYNALCARSWHTCTPDDSFPEVTL
jgi:hypothetical protein